MRMPVRQKIAIILYVIANKIQDCAERIFPESSVSTTTFGYDEKNDKIRILVDRWYIKTPIVSAAMSVQEWNGVVIHINNLLEELGKEE